MDASFASRFRVAVASLAIAFFSCGGVLAFQGDGRLNAGDWHAQWIGLDGVDQTNWIEGGYPGFVDATTTLSWIWSADGNAEKSAPRTNYFRRVIVIPTEKPALKEVHFQFAGDSECHAWINGFDLGVQNGFRAVKDVDITYRTHPGSNVICLAGIDPGPAPKPAGVVAMLQVAFVRGDDFFFWTDEQWKVSRRAEEGWNKLDFDDSKWAAVRVLGPVGMAPWGKIRTPESRRQPARYLRKDFVLGKKVARATVYFCGLGWSELYLNGEKVGDAVLSPGVTDYSRHAYVSYDVTKQLRNATNTLGVILGNGNYYAPRSEVYPGVVNYGWPKMLLQLRVEYSDGSTSEVVSDGSWKVTTEGPIRANNLYDGEEFDANYDLAGWNLPGYDATPQSTPNAANASVRKYNPPPGTHEVRQTLPQWQSAQELAAPVGELVAQSGDPIRVKQTLKAAAVTEPKPDVFIFDMGRNVVGWCRLKVRGPSEDRIVLRYAATLKPDGTLDLANVGGAEATDVYTLRGTDKEEVWEPRFTCHRFRYVEVTGYPNRPALDAIEGRVLNADVFANGQVTPGGM
jgi:alpha-L-rhamnosidase